MAVGRFLVCVRISSYWGLWTLTADWHTQTFILSWIKFLKLESRLQTEHSTDKFILGNIAAQSEEFLVHFEDQAKTHSKRRIGKGESTNAFEGGTHRVLENVKPWKAAKFGWTRWFQLKRSGFPPRQCVWSRRQLRRQSAKSVFHPALQIWPKICLTRIKLQRMQCLFT